MNNDLHTVDRSVNTRRRRAITTPACRDQLAQIHAVTMRLREAGFRATFVLGEFNPDGPPRELLPVEVVDRASMQIDGFGWFPMLTDAVRHMDRDGWGEAYLPTTYRKSKWWRGDAQGDRR